jgi:tRNA 2-thiouridine synthesizing protein C
LVAELTVKKRMVIVIRHAPYGDSMARASVDLALAMGAFEQDFDLLFMGEGVLQLLPHQDAGAIGLKNTGRALSSLPLVDVDSVYVDASALARYGLNEQELVLPTVPVEGDRLHRLLCDCDHLVGC